MGYIIGPRVAGVIFAGGVFSWLVLMPLIYFFGSHMPDAIYPGTKPIARCRPPIYGRVTSGPWAQARWPHPV